MPFLAGLAAAALGGVASAGASALLQGTAQNKPVNQMPLIGGFGGNQLTREQEQALLGAQAKGASPEQVVSLKNQMIQMNQAQAAQGAATQATGGLQTQFSNQNALQSQLAGQNGIGNQSDVFNQQQQLANLLALQAQGQGPNPAQAMLNQATGQNVANQAALMASQRGASANPALVARQAAQQGAGIQQNAVGQAASLGAQQQLAFENALQQQQGMLGNLATTQVGQQVQNQQNLTGQNLAEQQAVLGNIAQQNATQSGLTNTVQTGQNELNTGYQKQVGGLAGGVVNGLGGAIQTGINPTPVNKAQGGYIENPKLGATRGEDRFPDLMIPPHLKKVGMIYHDLSFGERYGSQEKPMAYGGNVGSRLKEGGQVPGKAKVPGDSEKNDTVKAKLSPGEVVLPRSVMQSQDPVSAAAQFVASLQNKKGSKSSGNASEFKQALHRAMKERKNK